MPPVVPHPPDLFAPGRRHALVLAHQDDELPYAGLVQRMGDGVHGLWLTNGDGLAHETALPARAYGEVRKAETRAAMQTLGVPPERVRCLDHSEYALYELMAQMVRGEHPDAVPPRFLAMADEVRDAVLALDPDVVWALAWQGGHPEHDLTHLYAARAALALGARRGAPVPLYELPAYELGVVALRFKPWRRAPVHEIVLTDEELARKQALMELYPSQARIVGGFRKLVGLYGRLSALRGRPFDLAGFSRREAFAPVPAGRRYTRSTHAVSWLDYPGDDYLGTPIRFRDTVARVASALGM